MLFFFSSSFFFAPLCARLCSFALVLESHWQPDLRVELKFPQVSWTGTLDDAHFPLQHGAGTAGLVCLMFNKKYSLSDVLVIEK